MAATGAHKRGAPIVVSPERVGTAEEFVERTRRPSTTPRVVVTTWECLACGNGIASKRGISRCPRCGSIEIVSVAAPTAPRAFTPMADDEPPPPSEMFDPADSTD